MASTQSPRLVCSLESPTWGKPHSPGLVEARLCSRFLFSFCSSLNLAPSDLGCLGPTVEWSSLSGYCLCIQEEGRGVLCSHRESRRKACNQSVEGKAPRLGGRRGPTARLIAEVAQKPRMKTRSVSSGCRMGICALREHFA